MKTSYTPQGKQFGDLVDAGTKLQLKRDEAKAILALAWRLFTRDVAPEYRLPLLDAIWAIIAPLRLVGAMIVLNASEIVEVESNRGVPFMVYAIIGVTLWYLFANSMSKAVACLNSAGSAVLRVNFR